MVAVRPHPKAGRLRVAWHSIGLANTRDTLGRPTPLLGEHTAEVMREIGYDDAAIAGHYAAGVVLTEKP
jgi:crotonobetainyl-CoA:carnitine CoA-transferase CaiB-like acyl-CoA transferase